MLPDDKQWFFIAGCQRSGTTLLRLVLECHSQIFCFDEAQSYRVLEQRTHDGAIGKRLVGFKIPRLTEQLDQADPRDHGLPERVGPFYRGQPVIFMVRDARDVVSSMLKLRGQRSWLEEWAIPIIEDKARDPEFARHYRRELALCRSVESPAAYGALYWSFKNDALERYLRAGHPVLPVRYEALVAEPRRELGAICRFLGVALEPTLLAHARQAHGELDERGLAIGNTDPRRSIDGASVGQWSAWLGEREQQLVDEISAPTAERVRELLATDGQGASGAPGSSPSSRHLASAWSVSGWLGILTSACLIAVQPAWSFGVRDLLFWLAALLSEAPRFGFAPQRAAAAGSAKRVGVMALAFTGLWVFVQSIRL
jgi:hypothetical protein